MFTAEQVAAFKATIVQKIAIGQSLKSITDADDMPSRETVYVWLAEDSAFADNYARAREDQADFYADEIIDIADSEEDANKARVRIDARKWKAARMKPKKYGDRLDIDQNTTLNASDPLVALLQDIASGGKRLTD